MDTQNDALLQSILACQLCRQDLPYPPKSILQADTRARILIAGQAPGRKAHDSGVPFDDASGDRLRAWLGVDRATFYDASQFAIVPMGFCYPGKARSGDAPPRPECAQQWRQPLLATLPNIELTLVLGKYAMAWHLPQFKGSLTEAVESWEEVWPSHLPLPHPSPRNQAWFKRNTWFETVLLPRLRDKVHLLLS